MNFQEEEKIANALAETGIQEPFMFRNLFRARALSDLLIDQEGLLIQKELPSFPEGIQGENDAFVICHFQQTLDMLYNSKDLQSLLKRFRVPVANSYIENLILCSLNLPFETKITNRELRRAILTALLTPLRQSVGSCFATAPGILIQREQIERLILDLYDLTMTSSLNRTFGGLQNVVPISPSWGVGDLKKPISLLNAKIFDSPGMQAALKAAGISTEEARELVPEHDFTNVNTLIQRIVYRFHGLTQTDLKGNFLSKTEDEVTQILSLEQQAKDAFKALTDHALLKVWEYTLASFSDYKIEFYRWNLYASLGFDSKEKGGIGHLLYEKLQEKLNQVNQKTEKFHNDYVHAADEARTTQSLLRQASTRDRVRQLKAELDMRLHHAQTCKDLRDDSHEKGKHLASFFTFLIEQYTLMFPQYFQEIYDAEMFDVKTSLYDDSPAGFRLVYKHGRRDPSAWTLIRDSEGYVQALKSFFLAVEPTIAAATEWEEGEEELQELTTLLLHHLDTEEFLTSAIERMGKAHQISQQGNSLENIERFEKKPWSYTSGGTMHTLIRCYYCLEKELSEEKLVVESPMNLLVFLLDLMKSLPYTTTRPFEENPEKGMLMFSPTHAFTFLPGLPSFKEGWLDKGFSYTWARDRVVTPGKTFYESIRLNGETQLFLAEKFLEKYIPHRTLELIHAFAPLKEAIQIPVFWKHLRMFLRQHLLESQALLDCTEGFLRTAFPLLSLSNLEKLLQDFPPALQQQFADKHALVYTAYDAYSYLYHLIGSKPHAYDILDKAFEKHGFLPPKPLLFADTNWSRYFFGFGYNPCLDSLDLWRLDARLREGYPLSVWRPFLDGSHLKPWGVLTQPAEYSGQALPEFNLLNKKV